MGGLFSAVDEDEPQEYAVIVDADMHILASTNNVRLNQFTNSPKNVKEWVQKECNRPEERHYIISDLPIEKLILKE